MTRFKLESTGAAIELEKDQFKTKGGEGAIYIVGNTVYKVCDPGKMIPLEKLKELKLLKHPKLITPTDVLLYRNQPTGYTMPLVPRNAVPLAQILTKTFREREGVTPNHMRDLVQQAADGLRYMHGQKIPKSRFGQFLQVDGNEFNYMVTEDFLDLYFIDMNSCQTPNFPADAIMASIQDVHCHMNASGMYQWSELTDWYSFAIISFYMFTGIHPFKGRHPNFTNVKTMMVDQMRACKSVLDPQSQFPMGAVYHPFADYIPGGADGAFMKWYKAIFVENKRLPAPRDFQAVMALAAKVIGVVGANNFMIQELQNYLSTIIAYYERSGKEVVVTKDFVHVMNRKSNRPAERFRVGFTPKNNTPYAIWIDNGSVKLTNLDDQTDIKLNLQGTDFMSCEGRTYIKGSNNIFEITFVEQGNILLAVPRAVASIMPTATTLFQGVAVQDMFGTPMVSIFPSSTHHKQLKIEELKDYRLTDGKYENGVLQITGFHNEQYDRFIFRFSTDWTSYDVRIVENITPMGVNFTVLDNGICVTITEDESVEIFSNKKDSTNVKRIDDPAIKGDMRLCHSGKQTQFAQGSKLYSIAVK